MPERPFLADGAAHGRADRDARSQPQRLVHRMVVMSRGEKIADGKVADIREDKEVLRAYGGV